MFDRLATLQNIIDQALFAYVRQAENVYEVFKRPSQASSACQAMSSKVLRYGQTVMHCFVKQVSNVCTTMFDRLAPA